MKYEYDSRKNCASPMKRTHNFFSAAHSAIPLPTVTCNLSPVTWTHTFSAKEKDVETGLSYFGSRYYSSDLSIWLSVDPMSDKYPHQSNYVYCSNNPIKVIDPNGEDEWDLARDGTLTKRENGRTDIDVVHATTKDGESISRTYKNGSINQDPQSKQYTFDDGIKKRIITTDYMSFNNSETATDFFEFAAENTDKEWAMKASSTEIFVGTSHEDGLVQMPSPSNMTLEAHSHVDKDKQIGSDHSEAVKSFQQGVAYKVYEVHQRSYATFNTKTFRLDNRELSHNLSKKLFPILEKMGLRK